MSYELVRGRKEFARRGLMGMVTLGLAASMFLTACGAAPTDGVSDSQPSAQSVTSTSHPDGQMDGDVAGGEAEEMALRMSIGETPVNVAWEDNESVEALRGLCAEGPLTIQMSSYGGFEQVGSLGQGLPRNDVQTTTQAGDIVLYAGDQMVVFYGSNSWAYTRLGRITDTSAEELAELLGNGDVTITIENGRSA